VNARLSSVREEGKIFWSSLMRCPNCGKESTVTNLCRECPMLPSDLPLNEEANIQLCSYHLIPHFVTVDDILRPSYHRTCKLEYTGLVQNSLTGERRLYQPKDSDEEVKLWIGYGVIFDE